MSEDSLILTEISHALAEMSKMDEAMLSTAKETRKSGTVDTVLESMGSLGEMVKVVKNIGSFTELLKMSGLGMLVKILGRITEPIDEALSDIEDELFQPLEDLGEAIADLIYDQAPQLIDSVHNVLVPMVQAAITWLQTEGAEKLNEIVQWVLGKGKEFAEWIVAEGPKMLEDISEVVSYVLAIKDKLTIDEDWFKFDLQQDDGLGILGGPIAYQEWQRKLWGREK